MFEEYFLLSVIGKNVDNRQRYSRCDKMSSFSYDCQNVSSENYEPLFLTHKYFQEPQKFFNSQ